MPRIRTLKPEHRQHRKVGPLTDREYRLWVSMILEAEDAGRLVCDAAQLRAVTWPYHPRVTTAHVEAAIQGLACTGMIRLYEDHGVRYADFPSWGDHQRIDHPAKSKLPEYRPSENPRESSRILANDPGGRDLEVEGKGMEGKGSLCAPRDEGRVVPWSAAPWPSPEALAHAYNTLTPDNVPSVQALSAKRREKALKMLRQFPDQAWWHEVFKHYHRSRFLSGRTTPRPGHEGFQPDFDWLLSNGQNGTENAVKVHDGNYR